MEAPRGQGCANRSRSESEISVSSSIRPLTDFSVDTWHRTISSPWIVDAMLPSGTLPLRSARIPVP